MVFRRFGTLYQFHLQGLDVDTLHPALEDGTDRGFRNVGKPHSDAGEIPKRIHTKFSNMFTRGSPSVEVTEPSLYNHILFRKHFNIICPHSHVSLRISLSSPTPVHHRVSVTTNYEGPS